MKSIITSKFQTTIPKGIREALHLSVKDALEWSIEEGRLVVKPIQRDFLARRNSVITGQGDIPRDIDQARRHRGEDAA